MNLWNRYLLWYWKRRLRLRYLNFRKAADLLSCGHSLASYVSGTYREALDNVNAAIRRINELDPKSELKEIK